jgi:hypothetical protein
MSKLTWPISEGACTNAGGESAPLSESGHSGYEKAKEDYMIVLGLILLILGWVLGIGILVTIGIILLIVGVVFLILGQTGRAVGGRKYWF